MAERRRSPLSWPTGWPRTPASERKHARWGKGKQHYRQDGTPSYRSKEQLTVFDAIARLGREVRRLGAADDVLTTNPLRGTEPTERSTADPGAALYFTLDGKKTVLACDRWKRVADNIAALAEHIEALRAIERYGVGSLAQAFAGYTALPPAGGETDWRAVLGIEADAKSITLAAVEARYRELARLHHPDVGGDPETMSRLNQAREAARRALG